MNTIELKAKAKVNLILNVLGKRPDGYHELQMVMQAIDLADDVRIEWERQTGEMAIRGCFLGGMQIALDPGHKKLPSGPNNLAYQAASKMYDAFHRGRREVCTIAIRKNIPLAAGLAGGSTDAAAVIWGLARLWDLAPNETDEGMDPEVRQKLLELQRALAVQQPVVMDGRDIGTVVLPDAETKVYLTASVEVRARRRYRELQEKGAACDIAEIEKDIRERDWRDMHRETAPLRQAEDAVLEDSSFMTAAEVTEEILDLVRREEV